jgi:hypothetical protein
MTESFEVVPDLSIKLPQRLRQGPSLYHNEISSLSGKYKHSCQLFEFT